MKFFANLAIAGIFLVANSSNATAIVPHSTIDIIELNEIEQFESLLPKPSITEDLNLVKFDEVDNVPYYDDNNIRSLTNKETINAQPLKMVPLISQLIDDLHNRGGRGEIVSKTGTRTKRTWGGRDLERRHFG